MDDAAAKMGRQMARWSSRLPLYCFPSIHLVAHSLCGSLPCYFVLQCDFWEAIPLSPFPVVSLRFAVSVLTAPVTHQVLDLQKNESSSPLRPLSRKAGPRKSSVPGRVQIVGYRSHGC